jgi:hypothetical protein
MVFPDDVLSPIALPAALNEATAPLFAEGRRLEAEGRYDEAFAAFAEGNRIKAEFVDPREFTAPHTGLVRLLKSVFTSAFLRENVTNNPDESPIFIVGLPRSGSTLVEQILCSHPQVSGMGESASLMRFVSAAFPFAPAGHLDPPVTGAAYIDAIKGEGWDGIGKFTDKMLINAIAVGHIHLMFPRSIIIHCTRSPIDTCLSCFRTDFKAAGWMQFAYDLSTIGQYYQSHREIMNHWNFVLMGRIVNVTYEDLVQHPTQQIRRLVDICRLPWDDACLQFFENPRPVFTASAEQVRRPIFGDSVGRWRLYRKHLGPLVEALGSYAALDDE